MGRPQLNAVSRAPGNSRVAGRMRKQGLVPGIVYGKTQQPVLVTINRAELIKFFNARAGEHGLLDLKVQGEGKAGWEKPVLVKALQRDPVLGHIVHIDFHAITLTEQVRVKVPVELIGVPVGVKQDGGLLEHFLRDVEVECLPTDIPKQIDFDIAELKIGDTIHAKDLPVPKGARITSEPDSVIASVHAPKAEKAEEVTEAAAEPEVIREKKVEEGAEGEGKPEAKKAEGKKDEK